MNSARIVIPGPGVTQGSMTSYGRGRMAHPPKLVTWRALAVTIMAAQPARFDGPVSVSLWAAFDRPPSHLRADGTVRKGFHDRVPTADLDKLQRAAGDALEASGVLSNDNLIVRWHAVKDWTVAVTRPAVVIDVTEYIP